MASKKHNQATSARNLETLKIGSRIRCTEDGVEGRIVWANRASVKIEWTDGEKVTWRRDSLATRPIEILDADGDDQTTTTAATDATEGIAEATEEEQPAALSDATAAEPTATTEEAQADTETTAATAEQPQAEPETTLTTTEKPQAEPETTPTTTEPTPIDPAIPATEPTAAEPATLPEATVEQATPSTEGAAAPSAKPKRQRKAPAEPKEKKVSALDAAAKVLAEEGCPMTCKELIAAMAAKGYWTSPGGQTPDATLYSAMLREIGTKGADARFVKSERGKFSRKS